MKSVSILGSGSWALALSKILKPTELIVKCRNIEKVKTKFKSYNVFLTDNFDKIIHTKIIFIAIPSQSVRQNLMDLKLSEKSKKEKKIFIICSKGVEQKTFKLMSEVVYEIFPKNMICPVFNSKMSWGFDKNGSNKNVPTLDKIYPKKGYIRGNVVWISMKANAIKQDATASEIHQVAEWYTKTTNQKKG